jgi:outer membrane protein
MTSKVVRIFVAAVFCLSLMALAQTTPPSNAAVPNAPSAATAAPAATGTKVGTINIELAVSACNEGQRDLSALGNKLAPKQTELKSLSEELDALKKQLNAQEGKLNEEARTNLVKQIETKQKVFDRSMQDAREDAQSQQGEIMQRILQKMAPVIVKYATDNGFGMIIDTSQPWPQGPVVWYGQAVDITQPVVEAYNVKSGVPAPPPPTSAGASKPAAGPARPATPATKPPASSPPKQ